MFKGKRILVAPLDWGLGHCSRCVPIVRVLAENNEIVLGCTSENSEFFRRYFPLIAQVNLPSYKIRYSAWLPQWLKILGNLPRIFRQVKREKLEVAKLCGKYKFDVLISDNRYGVFHNSAQNVFITHQLRIKLPFFSDLVSSFQARYLKRFSEIWVPDHADRGCSLAGDLSHHNPLALPLKYLGPQSALVEQWPASGKSFSYEVLILLSGPEPQRTILEKKLLKRFSSGSSVALVRGSNSVAKSSSGIAYVANISAGEELSELIRLSKKIVCRSGYSTLMDLHLLQKKDLLLIPTPGQPEQEYLAEWWSKHFGAEVILQKDLR